MELRDDILKNQCCSDEDIKHLMLEKSHVIMLICDP